MFTYTKAAINKIIDDIKKIVLMIKLCSQFLSIVYLTYAVIAQVGNFIANVILLALCVAYTIFDLITYDRIEKAVKTARKAVRRTYSWSRILVKAFTLSIAIYGIYSMTTSVTPISIILTTLMIITWVLNVLFEIIKVVFDSKKNLLFAGMQKDAEQFAKPAKKVGNFFKRIAGKKVEKEQKTSHAVKVLEKQIDKEKERKAFLKAEKKRLKLKKANKEN